MNIDKYYRALGITGTEDTRKIKRVFMKVAQRYHPDKNQNSAESLEKFIDAKDAYENIIKFRKDAS